MSANRKNLIISALAALTAGVILGAIGFGVLQVGLIGGVVFVLTNLGLKNGLGRQSVMKGGFEERQTALHAPVSEGQSSLIVFRDGGRPNLGIDVAIDGNALARLNGGCFSQISLSPGTYSVNATFSQGILGAIPLSQIAIELTNGETVAIAVSLPASITVKAVDLQKAPFEQPLISRLEAMSLVVPQTASRKV